MKRLYLIRHCEAESQHPDSGLTCRGRKQSLILADFLSNRNINYIVSSTFTRAIQSIEPFAKRSNIKIHEDKRFVEHILCDPERKDWKQFLRKSFDNLDLSLDSCESSREATERAISAIEDILQTGNSDSLIVTHGKLLTLILKHYDIKFGYDEWLRLTNPDVYLVELSVKTTQIKRIWDDMFSHLE